jgi:hypothetical protein
MSSIHFTYYYNFDFQTRQGNLMSFMSINVWVFLVFFPYSTILHLVAIYFFSFFYFAKKMLYKTKLNLKILHPPNINFVHNGRPNTNLLRVCQSSRFQLQMTETQLKHKTELISSHNLSDTQSRLWGFSYLQHMLDLASSQKSWWQESYHFQAIMLTSGPEMLEGKPGLLSNNPNKNST